MENRALIAIFLSVAVLVLYSVLFPQQPPVNTEQPAKTSAAPGVSEAGPAPPPAEMPAGAVEGTPALDMQAPEKDITVETGLYTAVISSKGGVIKSWKLSEYKDEAGKPVEMAYPDYAVKPLLVVPGGMDAAHAGQMDYRSDKNRIKIDGGDGSAVLELSYYGADGRSVIKTLTFNSGTYAVGLDVAVHGFDGYKLLMGEDFGSLTPMAGKGYGFVGPLIYVDGEFKEKGFVHWVSGLFGKSGEEKKDIRDYKGSAGWTGLTDKYFLAAVVPDGGIDAVVATGATDWGYVGVEAPANGEPFKGLFYAGPKEYDILKATGHDLRKAVDFGWFTFIAKPLFVSLKFLHGLIGNYGWAIIIITFIIKLAFAPLTHKQQKSMKRMSALQPRINELKEKFKGDPQRMNTEMMELYKKEKVNPLGGCLPMLVQIPVFIALYNVLNNAIELRHAPFALWLVDLSAKDPYYILPVLMGVSMFVMQKMTPSTMEPAQAKMMMFLPVVMTFMFISLPSGLVLYFTVSNLLSMAQQLYINKSAAA